MVAIGLVIAIVLVVGGVLLALAILGGVWLGTQAMPPEDGRPAPPEWPPPTTGEPPA